MVEHSPKMITNEEKITTAYNQDTGLETVTDISG